MCPVSWTSRSASWCCARRTAWRCGAGTKRWSASSTPPWQCLCPPLYTITPCTTPTPRPLTTPRSAMSACQGELLPTVHRTRLHSELFEGGRNIQCKVALRCCPGENVRPYLVEKGCFQHGCNSQIRPKTRIIARRIFLFSPQIIWKTTRTPPKNQHTRNCRGAPGGGLIGKPLPTRFPGYKAASLTSESRHS